RKGHKLLITDGVFSMDGDIAPLPDLVKLAEEYGCIMMIDDAHASGVLGRNGRGSVDHFSLHGRVDIQVGTLSKAIGALGGHFCSPPLTLRQWRQRVLRPSNYSMRNPNLLNASGQILVFSRKSLPTSGSTPAPARRPSPPSSLETPRSPISFPVNFSRLASSRRALDIPPCPLARRDCGPL